MIRKISYYKLLLFKLLIVRCEDNSLNDTSKNTYYDDIADITYLNGSFFTTNYDLSNNAGSQIDLIKFVIIIKYWTPLKVLLVKIFLFAEQLFLIKNHKKKVL